MNKSDEIRLDSFQYQCLKKALQIFWSNIICITEDLKDLKQHGEKQWRKTELRMDEIHVKKP